MRRTFLIVVVAALGALAAVGHGAPAAAQDDTVADRLVALTNQERRDRGIPEVTVSRELTATSCDWNRRIMSDRQLNHDPNLQGDIAAVIPYLQRWAENLATGPTADAIHNGWMASSAHAPHILDPQLQLIGICADRDSANQIWVTQRFATAGSPPATTQPTTARVMAPRTTRPPTTATPVTVAPSTAPPSTPPPTEAPTTTTTVETVTSTTTAVAVDAATSKPEVALDVQHVSSSRNGLSAPAVLAVVGAALVLLSLGVLVVTRSRKRSDDA